MSYFRISLGPAVAFVDTFADLVAQQERLRVAGTPPLTDIQVVDSVREPVVVHEEIAADDDPSLDFRPDLQRLLIRCAASEIDQGASLLHYAHLLLEADLQRLGYVTAHCAAVELEGAAVLLLGKTGAGKTTTAIKLCMQAGGRLIGNDLCVLGFEPTLPEAQVIAGTKYILLRLLAAQRDFPDLVHLFANAGDGDPWTTKVPLNPQAVGIAGRDEPCPIRHAYFVHVDSSQPTEYEGLYNPLVLKLFLYENFSRYVRATTTPVLLGADFRLGPFMPAFDTREAHERRSTLIEYLVSRVGVRYISGPAQAVADRILALVTGASAGGLRISHIQADSSDGRPDDS